MRSFFSLKFFEHLRIRFAALWTRPWVHIIWWFFIIAACLLLYHASELELYAKFHFPIYPWIIKIPGLLSFASVFGLLTLLIIEFYRFQSDVVRRQLTDDSTVTELKDSPRLLDRIPKEQ